MNYDEITRRLEDELFKKVEKESKSQERLRLEEQYKINGYRYEASRSAAGLEYCGPDKKASPLDDPFPGAADIGSPIECTVTQELVPNVLAAHIGSIPFTETKVLTDKGLQPYGLLDHFLYFELAHKAKIRPLRRQTVLGSYKYGEYIEKVTLEKQKRYVIETRVFLLAGKTVLMGQDKREVEINEKLEDIDGHVLYRKMLELVSGQDQRSLKFRYATEVMKFDGQTALEAAGIEVRDKDVRIAPLVPGEPPQPDWSKAKVYKPEEVDIKEEIVIGHQLDFSLINPSDFVVPSDARSNDIMDYWNCHRYNEPLEWLIERKGNGHGDGFFEDRVERIVQMFKEKASGENKKKEGKDEPEIWEVYDRFVLNADDDKRDDYMREIEIIAWFCPDLSESPLLGWTVNPFARFPIKHVRPFFLFQVKPENDRYHGLSIPETVAGLREMMDHLINGMMNRSAMYSDPVTVMSPTCFEIEDNQKWGPGARWVKEVNDTLEVVKYYTPEMQNMEIYKMLNLAVRVMWGASEHLSGFATRTESKTLGEAQMLASKGAQMYADTVESIAQVCDLQYDFIRCLYLYSGEVESIEFPINEAGLEGTVREETMRMTKKMLGEQVFIKSRRVLTEADREVSIKAMMAALDFVGKTSPQMIQSPMFIRPHIVKFYDLLNMEDITIPTVEEMQKEQAVIRNFQEQMKEQERFQKAAEQIRNKGARNIVQKFLEQAQNQTGFGAPGAEGGQVLSQGVPV